MPMTDRPLVILDANALGNDWTLSHKSLEELFTHARAGRLRLVVPEVVELELIGRLDRELSGKEAKLEAAVEALLHLGVTELDRVRELATERVRVASDRYRERLTVLLQTTAERLAIDVSDAVRAVKRAAERRRPANQKGEELRDAIIWEGVLRLAASLSTDTPIYVVTSDGGFFSDDKSQMHPQVAEDIDRAARRIVLMRTIEDVFPKLGLALQPPIPFGSPPIHLLGGTISVPLRGTPNFELVAPHFSIAGRGYEWYRVNAILKRPLKPGAVPDFEIRVGGMGFANGQWKVGRLEGEGFFGGEIRIGGSGASALTDGSSLSVSGSFDLEGRIVGYTGRYSAAYEGDKKEFDIPLLGHGVATATYVTYEDPSYGRLFDPVQISYRLDP